MLRNIHFYFFLCSLILSAAHFKEAVSTSWMQNFQANNTGYQRPTRSVDGSCLVPNNPPNGEFKVGSASSNPGDYAPPFSALVINCKNRYKPYPPQRGNYPICNMGQWSIPPPTCARFCPSIKPTVTTKVSCKFDNLPMDSCENPVEGTIASLSCESLYEEPGLLRNPKRICKDGSWDYHISECLPVCGVKRPENIVNLTNDTSAQIIKGISPWQIGIYDPTNSLICGGSILSPRVVITAAHCFTPGDTLVNIENYTVAAGKYYSKYNDDRDEHAQYSKIDEVHIPQRYKGSVSFYEADIAVLILKTKLNISQVVQPVCIDWGNNFEYQQLAENKEGMFSRVEDALLTTNPFVLPPTKYEKKYRGLPNPVGVSLPVIH